MWRLTHVHTVAARAAGSTKLARPLARWQVTAEFIDPVGQPMSDHAPVSVTLQLSLVEGQ